MNNKHVNEDKNAELTNQNRQESEDVSAHRHHHHHHHLHLHLPQLHLLPHPLLVPHLRAPQPEVASDISSTETRNNQLQITATQATQQLCYNDKDGILPLKSHAWN